LQGTVSSCGVGGGLGLRIVIVEPENGGTAPYCLRGGLGGGLGEDFKSYSRGLKKEVAKAMHQAIEKVGGF